MTTPVLAVLVRFTTSLSEAEVMRIARKRAGAFRALDGLMQKYYVHDAATGEFGGLYLWDSTEAFDDYKSSDLRQSIAGAFHTESAPRVEVMKVLMPLRD